MWKMSNKIQGNKTPPLKERCCINIFTFPPCGRRACPALVAGWREAPAIRILILFTFPPCGGRWPKAGWGVEILSHPSPALRAPSPARGEGNLFRDLCNNALFQRWRSLIRLGKQYFLIDWLTCKNTFTFYRILLNRNTSGSNFERLDMFFHRFIISRKASLDVRYYLY